MLTKQIQISLSRISGNRLYSFLNILGISVALTSVIYIFLWVYYELSYDKFNTNYHCIYQINGLSKDGNRFSGSPLSLASAIVDHSPEIKSIAIIRKFESTALCFEDKMFIESNGITSDPEIFDIFSFKPVIGNAKKALNTENSIVITKSFAQRYFGNENPLGKKLMHEGDKYLTVQAVIEDVPMQSHLQFDFIVPNELTIGYMNWANAPVTYVLLHQNANPRNALNSITQVALSNKMPFICRAGNSFVLRPLKDIYLDSGLTNSFGNTGDKRNVIIFSSVGLLILLLACINYINISISLITKRLKSSSIKKICGASKKSIFFEHLFESAFLILISLLISLLLVFFLKPYFISFIGKDVSVILYEPVFFMFNTAVFIGVVLLSGIYPAIKLSQSHNLNLFSDYKGTRTKNRKLQIMLGIQNAISITLIICTIGIYKQMSYLHQKDLGFKTSQVLYFQLRGNVTSKVETIKNELSRNPNILQFALKDCAPFEVRKNTRKVIWKDNGELMNSDNSFGLEETIIDEQYFKMMRVKFAEGRDFDASLSTDKQNYILNEEAIRRMGLIHPVGQEFSLYGQWGKIVGVIKDTYFKTLHTKIEPQVFHLYKDMEKESSYSILFIKLNDSDIPGTIAQIDKIWSKNNPGIPFEYHFLDKDYEMLYKSDLQIAKLIYVFALLALLIACLGLFGQSTFTAENRTKEIGIHKVNGVKVGQVMAMLNKYFLKWVAIAFVIACPIAWYAMHRWLENFAYKTDISWWVFLASGIAALVVASLTVSWQSWRAATRNPVEALRYE